MTAIVFLKKSHKLAQDKHALEYITGEDPGEKAPASSCLTTDHHNHFARLGQRKAGGEHHPNNRRGLSTSESLLDDSGGDDSSLAELMMKFEPLKPTTTMRLTVSSSTPAKLGNKPGNEKSNEDDDSDAKENGVHAKKIPEWEDVFWKKYGNKIRIGQSGLMMYTGGRL